MPESGSRDPVSASFQYALTLRAVGSPLLLSGPRSRDLDVLHNRSGCRQPTISTFDRLHVTIRDEGPRHLGRTCRIPRVYKIGS